MAGVNETATTAEPLPEGATVPVIRDLPLRSHSVMPERPVREVVELLFEQAGAEAVALVDRDERPVGWRFAPACCSSCLTNLAGPCSPSARLPK